MMQFALVTFQTRWVSLIHRISSLCRMLDIALGICNDAPDKQLGFLDSTAVVWHMPTIHGWCIAMLCFRCNQKPFSLSVPAPISFGAWYASLAAGVCVCISEDTLKNAQRACILLESPQKGCMMWHDMISLNMLNKLKSIHLPTSDLMADLSGYVCAGGVYMEYWKSGVTTGDPNMTMALHYPHYPAPGQSSTRTGRRKRWMVLYLTQLGCCSAIKSGILGGVWSYWRCLEFEFVNRMTNDF
jgi:hypothetical protein